MSNGVSLVCILLSGSIHAGILQAPQWSVEDDRRDSRNYATIETSAGSVDIELLGDQAPRAVENFVQLAGGVPLTG